MEGRSDGKVLCNFCGGGGGFAGSGPSKRGPSHRSSGGLGIEPGIKAPGCGYRQESSFQPIASVFTDARGKASDDPFSWDHGQKNWLRLRVCGGIFSQGALRRPNALFHPYSRARRGHRGRAGTFDR